jgi:hypothetical protein
MEQDSSLVHQTSKGALTAAEAGDESNVEPRSELKKKKKRQRGVVRTEK